jgi:glycosyltransferase involved in cell wall biosynthesis
MLNPTTICHLSTVHRGLDIRIFWKECLGLTKVGFNICLVIQASEAEQAEAASLGVKLIRLQAHKSSSRLLRMSVGSFAGVRAAVKTGAPVIHVHDPELLFYAPLLRLIGRRIIYDAHEDLPKTTLGKYWIPKTLRSALSHVVQFGEHLLTRFTCAAVTAAPPITDRLLTVKSKVITLVNYPLRAEIESTQADIPNKPLHTICYAGAITEERGALDMVKALERMPGVRLELCGPVSPPELLTQLESCKGWSQVRYHGMVSRDAVAKIYAQSSIGLAMLHPTPSHVQWVPIKLFEYMAAGLAVVVPPYSVWKRFVDTHQCGITIEPKDPQLLGDAILKLMSDPKRLRSYAYAGREAVVKNYSWEAELERLVALYEGLGLRRNLNVS